MHFSAQRAYNKVVKHTHISFHYAIAISSLANRKFFNWVQVLTAQVILTSLGFEKDPLYKDKSIVDLKIPGKYT